MNLCGVAIGPDEPCRFVAELSNNHNGDLQQALAMIEVAKAAGADFVKIQTYDADELIALRGDGPPPEAWAAKGYTMRSLYRQAATPRDWLCALFAHAKVVGIPMFSSVFGVQSLELLEAVGCPAYKLASLDYDAAELRYAVEETGKPVLRSCAHDYAPAYDGLMLYCPPGYPQPHAHLKNLRHGYDGFSYHGTDAFVPVAAAALGAHLIEAHFQLAASPSALESDISLDEEDFAAMVAMVRDMERLAE